MIALAFLLGLALGNFVAVLGAVLMAPEEKDDDQN